MLTRHARERTLRDDEEGYILDHAWELASAIDFDESDDMLRLPSDLCSFNRDVRLSNHFGDRMNLAQEMTADVAHATNCCVINLPPIQQAASAEDKLSTVDQRNNSGGVLTAAPSLLSITPSTDSSAPHPRRSGRPPCANPHHVYSTPRARESLSKSAPAGGKRGSLRSARSRGVGKPVFVNYVRSLVYFGDEYSVYMFFSLIPHGRRR